MKRIVKKDSALFWIYTTFIVLIWVPAYSEFVVPALVRAVGGTSILMFYGILPLFSPLIVMILHLKHRDEEQ